MKELVYDVEPVCNYSQSKAMVVLHGNVHMVVEWFMDDTIACTIMAYHNARKALPSYIHQS
jgi:hypothetical protein